MAKKPQSSMDIWRLWRSGDLTVTRTHQDICDLLDAHDAAIKAITDALNELPERSAKPMVQRVTTILRDGLKASAI